MKTCPCEEWRVGNGELVRMSMLAATHQAPYSGPEMSYCPWCGQALRAGAGFVVPAPRATLTEPDLIIDEDMP